MLHDFILANRDDIIRRTRQKASTRSSLRPTDADLDQGIPLFLDELAHTLRRSTAEIDVASTSATKHGANLHRMGFTIAQVVHGYGDVCQSVTELAIEVDASIGVDDFRLFNRCLDESIADAVTEYEKRGERLIADRGNERVAVLAHEMRNALHTAMLSFGALKRGAVGTESSTANLLNRSLIRLNDILERSLAEVRLESGTAQHVRIPIAAMIEDIEVASALEAVNRRVTFQAVVDSTLMVEGDILLLAGALTNLLQNAFKFSRSGGHVTLTARSSVGRVLLEVEDECGGLPSGYGEELFRLFEQQGVDRSGLGVGLAVARTSVRAMQGEIDVRDLPGKGCVFTIDLPEAPRA